MHSRATSNALARSIEGGSARYVRNAVGERRPVNGGPMASAEFSADVRKRVSRRIVVGLVGIVDALAVFGSGLAAAHWAATPGVLDGRLTGLSVALGAILAINLLIVTGVYRLDRLCNLNKAFAQILFVWLATMTALTAVSWFEDLLPDATHRWLLLWFIGGLSLLAIDRTLLQVLARRWRGMGRLARTVAVIGSGPVAQRLLRHMNANPDPFVRIMGVYDDRRDRLPASCMGHAILGEVADLIKEARARRVDTVIVALPLSADWRLAEILNKLCVVPVDVRLCPDQFGLQLGAVEVSHVNGLTLLNVIDRPLRDWRSVAKEIEDRVLAALILMLISPLMAAIGILIKLDSPGPVFFTQKRYGFNNELIRVLKFRTMYHHARDPNAEQLTRRQDPRVTRIGAILRRTSLDELPQFINVLRGEMSIVGPRPHALSAKAGGLLYQDAVMFYDARHRMKPGITGWAQVNGWRGETETVEQIQRRVEHDLYYIQNWSILLDLKIILRTILGGFTGRYAY